MTLWPVGVPDGYGVPKCVPMSGLDVFRCKFDEVPLMVGIPYLLFGEPVVLGLEVPCAVDLPWIVVHIPGKTCLSIEVDVVLSLMVVVLDLPAWLAVVPRAWSTSLVRNPDVAFSCVLLPCSEVCV